MLESGDGTFNWNDVMKQKQIMRQQNQKIYQLVRFWCMAEWRTQNLHRDGSISHGTSHATTKECCQYSTFVDINMQYKRIQSLLQNHGQRVHLLESRE